MKRDHAGSDASEVMKHLENLKLEIHKEGISEIEDEPEDEETDNSDEEHIVMP